MIFKTYRLIWGLLTRRERIRFVALTVLTILAAVFEVIGVAGILPFLSVLAEPELIETNVWLQRFAAFFGLEDRQSITIALGLAVLATIIVSMAIRALMTYAQIRFSLMRAYAISSRLLRGYLQQDYAYYLSRNTSDLGQSLLSEVDLVVRESVLPAVLVISNIMMVCLVGSLLFLVEPMVALGATGLLLSTYLVVFFVFRRRLGDIGKRRVAANSARFKVVQEAAGGLKEIKVMGLESTSIDRFRKPAEDMATLQTVGLLIARLPRYALEATTYGGFIAMVLVLILVKGETIGGLVPLLGLIGMSATKLFPALQQMFQQLSSIKFSAAGLERLHERLHSFVPPTPEADVAPLRLHERLTLDGLHYRYPAGEKDTLNGLSATIQANTTVGIVGGTGAGKTTVIDLILGLLRPDQGEIRVDGDPITDDRVRAWQKSIGYVPQTIFLTDDTVAANIAFGVAPDQIDMAAVEQAARIANLHDFVMAEMPQGYHTQVGERGVRLSGGQRQRIGIARALYHDPDLLILDEATSALDNLTERAVMEAVHALGHKKTVIMIAHRLSTVEACDTILLLEGGVVADQGTYTDLIAGNAQFRRMANG